MTFRWQTSNHFVHWRLNLGSFAHRATCRDKTFFFAINFSPPNCRPKSGCKISREILIPSVRRNRWSQNGPFCGRISECRPDRNSYRSLISLPPPPPSAISRTLCQFNLSLSLFIQNDMVRRRLNRECVNKCMDFQIFHRAHMCSPRRKYRPRKTLDLCSQYLRIPIHMFICFYIAYFGKRGIPRKDSARRTIEQTFVATSHLAFIFLPHV